MPISTLSSIGQASDGVAVSSAFGRTGAVVASASDYDDALIDNTSDVTGATVQDALNALYNRGQVATFSFPLKGFTNTQLFFTGTLRSIASGLTADYAVDFAVSNQHVYILVNSITTGGTITFTGTSLSETTAIPVTDDTETITIDTSASQYYQTSKKWLEITNVDLSAGVAGINYNIGVVGYTDVGNANFRITGYRLDARASNNSADFRFKILKIQDDGNDKFSIVTIEDIGAIGSDAGNQIVDHLRTGDDDRSYNPTVATVWGGDTTLTFKMGDFNSYFSSNENTIEGATKDEGVILEIDGESGGISNVDYITLQIRFTVV